MKIKIITLCMTAALAALQANSQTTSQTGGNPASAGNDPGFSNQFSMNTNNSSGGLSPTSSRTNSSGGLNNNTQIGVSNRTSVTFQDRAFTVSDQALLTQIRQVVTRDFGTPSGGTTVIPVYFVVRNGVVQLVGTVPTIMQKRRVEAMVRRVPGVIQVIDQLQINATTASSVNESFDASSAQAGMSSNTPSGFSSTNLLTPTGVTSNTVDQLTGSTNQSKSSMETNLPPTSRTNDSSHSSGLPSGLEKQNQPPSGLEGRTNSSGSNP